MAYETPSFEKYKMPIGGFGAAVQGAMTGLNEVMSLRETLDKMKTAGITRDKMTQEMKEAETMFPLKMQESKATIQAIISNTSLDSARRKEMLAKAAEAYGTVDLNKIKSKYPLLSVSGPAGQIGAALYLRDNPELNKTGRAPLPQTPQQQQNLKNTFSGTDAVITPDQYGKVSIAANAVTPSSAQAPQSLSDMIIENIGRTASSQEARANYFNMVTKAYPYRLTPPDQKSALIAQASGMGYDPTEASNAFINGKTIFDLAKDKGFDPQNMPDPINPLTSRGRSQVQQRQQALAEVNSIMPDIINAVAPYSERFSGYSPKQISEALKGENEQAQGEFLGAMGLMPEMSGMRFRAMAGSQLGVEAIKEITRASMGNISVYQPLVSPKVYKIAQEFMDSRITKGVDAANTINQRVYSQSAQATVDKSTKEMPNFSEEDIKHTMKVNNLSRDQVMTKLKNKYSKDNSSKNDSLSNKLDLIDQQLEDLKAGQLSKEEEY